MLTNESKEKLLFLIQEIADETRLAESASLLIVKKHVQRIAELQMRFNIEIVKAVANG